MKIKTRLAQITDICRIAEITQEHEPKSMEEYVKAFEQQKTCFYRLFCPY